MDRQKIESLWAHLHSLVVLAEAGSYTAAAAQLGVSKAAMSLRIAELERTAGIPLVQRTTRSVRLTEAGQQLVDETRASFATIERSFVGVRDLGGEPRGLVRMTAPVALGRQQIVPRLPAFLAQYPQVRVELELSDSFASLAREGFDLAVRHTSAAPDTHIAWTLCKTRAALVATRSYLRRHGAPHSPADLSEHQCLHYFRRGEQPTWSFEPIRGNGARQSVAIQGGFAANNSEALRDAALAGLGIALVPDFTAQADLQSGRLVQVLPGWRPTGAFGEHIYAIRPYSPLVPRAVRALVDYLREALRDGFRLP
ncbi:DNA-binding transcriptional LysR family regulator [Cupriavidus gilardii J11]|uniref:DNA-binding transcriptional LysR family regulator n=1 Tax=Cupriavidus gilardii J11 TaxID=936133 RepID=A0A562BUY3_9BURK|nr:LysR family transcriptional regulator [Cupriavidus gilardii]TWG88503.1 DNA-binding transcriptional LysR family regulator [Cupriavidus gilardii J11]